MSTLYFWGGQEVITVNERLYTNRHNPLMDGLLNLPCVDTFNTVTRYRKYVSAGGTDGTAWVHQSLEEFPKEFRTALLLLGVPT